MTDEKGAVRVIDQHIAGSGKLYVALLVSAAPVSLGTTVKSINVVEPDKSGLVPECKFVLVGDSGVGKTSFLAALRADSVSDPSQPPGCRICGLTLQTNRGPVGCKFWDIGCAPEQAGVRDAYYSSAHAAILFFNFGNPQSYWNVLKWQNDVHRVCGDIPVVVVGCGEDLREAQAGPLAKSPAMRVCCFSGAGVLAPLLRLLRTITADNELCMYQDPDLDLSGDGKCRTAPFQV